MPFDQPNAGSSFQAKDYVGALLLVYPRSHEQGITTSIGVKDAIRADLVVLDGPSGIPEIHVDVLLFQMALIGQLRANVGRDPVLGRLTLGVAKPGMNPPYRLDSFTPADGQVAEKYLAAHPDPFAEVTPVPQPAFTPPAVTGSQPASQDPQVAELLRQLQAAQGAQAPPF